MCPDYTPKGECSISKTVFMKSNFKTFSFEKILKLKAMKKFNKTLNQMCFSSLNHTASVDIRDKCKKARRNKM